MIAGLLLGVSAGILLHDWLSRKHFDARLNEAVKKAYKAGLDDGYALPLSWDRHMEERKTPATPSVAPHEDRD